MSGAPALHTSTEARVREEICTIGASLYQRGYTVGTAGNISARLDDGWLITPTDACLGFLDAARLSHVGADLVHRLEQWFRFFFHDFVPLVHGVFSWRSPTGTRPLRSRQAVPCTDCYHMVVPIAGEVGVLVDSLKKPRN